MQLPPAPGRAVRTARGGPRAGGCRAYYCPACGSGSYLRDAVLGLVGCSLSPGVLRMTGSAAALVSFAESSALLDELPGVRVEAK